MQTFLSNFTQRFGYDGLFDILNNQSYWVKSIPHEWSGPCFTYNPKRQSYPGTWHSIGIVPNIGLEGPYYMERRRNLSTDLRIYLHEPNKFFLFKEGEAPSNVALDLNLVQTINRTRIVGN